MKHGFIKHKGHINQWGEKSISREHFSHQSGLNEFRNAIFYYFIDNILFLCHHTKKMTGAFDKAGKKGYIPNSQGNPAIV